MTDADRYIWLLSHIGLVQDEVFRWKPGDDRPLLRHLQDFIDREAPKAGSDFIERQRLLLRD